MNIDKLKRRYADIRWGYAQFGFFIGLANFLILVYNFTPAKDIISFEIFVPITLAVFLLIFTYSGQLFRNKQMATDHDLGFERNPAMAKVLRIILEQQELKTDEIIQQINYLRKIETQTI